MPIDSINININRKARSFSPGEPVNAIVAPYNAEFDTFGDIVYFSGVEAPQEAELRTALQRVRYGEFMFCVFSAEIIASLRLGFFSSFLEPTFGVTQWRDFQSEIGVSLLDADTPVDYYFFSRRGDFTFVPREGVETRNGRSFSVSVQTSLVEQFGEDGTSFTPVSYAGKVRGKDAPKAHRLYRRRPRKATSEPEGPAGRITLPEVTQEDYNSLARPDLSGIQSSSGYLLQDDMIRTGADAEPLSVFDLEDDWVGYVDDSPQSAAGLSYYRGGLVMGRPALYDFGGLLGEDGAYEDERTHAGSPALEVRKEIQSSSGFIYRGRFWLSTDQVDRISISAYRDDDSPSWDSGYGLVFDQSNEVLSIADEDANVPLVTTPMLLEGETEYEFILEYNEPPVGSSEKGITFSAWVWEAGAQRPDDPTIEAGAYVPQNLRESPDAVSSVIGVGVERSSAPGSQPVDPVLILTEVECRSLVSAYPQALLDLDVSGQRGELEVSVTARGQGARPLEDGGVEASYGHAVYVWDLSNLQWVEVDAPSYTSYSFYTHSFKVPLLPEYIRDGRILVLVTTAFPHAADKQSVTEGLLELDYFYGRSLTRERKTYGKTDFFFVQRSSTDAIGAEGVSAYRPSVSEEIVIDSPSSINVLSPSSEDGLGFSAPVEEITSVRLGEGDAGIEMRPREDYRYFWTNDGVRGSMREEVVLVLNETALPITVTARVHSMVATIDRYLSTADERKIDSDILARHKSSVFVDINGVYRGSPVPGLNERVRQYIYEQTPNQFVVSDLVRFLVSQGVEGILLYDGTNADDALTIAARRIDAAGNEQVQSTFQLVEKSVTEAFVPGNVNLLPAQS